MGSYFVKPVQVTLGSTTYKAKAFDTYGDFRSWAHRNFNLQGSAKDYDICRLRNGGLMASPRAPVVYSPNSDFDNPTRLWLKTRVITYEFYLAYDINGRQ